MICSCSARTASSFINFKDKVALGALTGQFASKPGSVAVVSASGSTGMQIASFAHQLDIGFTHLISTGNEAGIGTAAIIDYLVDDPAVKSIAIFAEMIRDPATFADAAIRAFAMRKPIVILKVGRAPATAALVSAHTGSLVGDDAVFDAMCDRYGIVRVGSTEALVITAAAMADIGPVKRPGVAFVSISGGACEMISDRAKEVGVPVPAFAPETQAELRKVVSDIGQTHNPLDLTGGAMRDPPMWEKVLRVISQDPQIGLTVCNFDIPAAPLPAWQSAWDHMAAGLRAADPPGPILTSYVQCFTDYGKSFIDQMNLPSVVSGIGTGLEAIGKLIEWSARLEREPPKARHTPAGMRAARPRSEREALDYLAGCGIPIVPARIARTEAEARQAFRDTGGPVALKILSPDIAHKTEIGGVLLNVTDEAAAASGFRRILASAQEALPRARIDGVVISPMRMGGVELFVGTIRDPQWGPVLSVGLGGVWVEALADTALELLPVSKCDVKRALGRLRGVRLLQGFRGAPAVDLDALAETVVRIGDAVLALGPELQSFEINPLLVKGSDIEALDALVVWGGKA